MWQCVCAASGNCQLLTCQASHPYDRVRTAAAEGMRTWRQRGRAVQRRGSVEDPGDELCGLLAIATKSGVRQAPAVAMSDNQGATLRCAAYILEPLEHTCRLLPAAVYILSQRKLR